MARPAPLVIPPLLETCIEFTVSPATPGTPYCISDDEDDYRVFIFDEVNDD